MSLFTILSSLRLSLCSNQFFVEGNYTAYIGLGSNDGNRMVYLQKSITLIFNKIGAIKSISPVYETPAWGFEGNDFLNLCIGVKTRLKPQKLLQTLLTIEKELGRQRSGSGYQNRVIDLDLLFYEDQIINSENLILPHPEIQNRRFVLQPLTDIASDFIHPTFQQSLSELLQKTSDSSDIKPYAQRIETTKFDFNPDLNYIVIEGNIGAGKTSLVNMIAQDYNAKIITERFKDNPFLPKFYKAQKRYAFPLEMSFLADRYQQVVDEIGQYDLFQNLIVADYDIYKSLIFAQVTLEEEEFQLYKRLFHIMYKDVAKPDLYVYLYQNTERLLKNIKKRGRDYEQDIPSEYLEKINQGYLNFIKTQDYLNVKIIDISDLDFVSNREDYLYLLKEINH